MAIRALADILGSIKDRQDIILPEGQTLESLADSLQRAEIETAVSDDLARFLGPEGIIALMEWAQEYKRPKVEGPEVEDQASDLRKLMKGKVSDEDKKDLEDLEDLEDIDDTEEPVEPEPFDQDSRDEEPDDLGDWFDELTRKDGKVSDAYMKNINQTLHSRGKYN